MTVTFQEMKQFRALSAALVSIAAFAVPARAVEVGVSGIYVMASPNLVEMVQLVRTPDGRVTARIEDVTIGPTGEIQDNSMAMEGAEDRGQIALSPRSGIVGLFGGSVTGTINGNVLDLLSSSSGHAILRRADLRTFDISVSTLRSRSAQLVEARREKEAVDARIAAVQSLHSVDTNLEDRLAKFEVFSQSATVQLANLRDQYDRLGRALAHSRRRERLMGILEGGGRAAMQAETDSERIVAEIDRDNEDVRSLRGKASVAYAFISTDISKIERACQQDFIVDRPDDPCHLIELKKARLNAAVTSLRESIDASDSAYRNATKSTSVMPR